MITANITGLDRLQRQLEELRSASVRRAIAQMESAIDAKTALYATNPLVAKVAEMTKQNLRLRILARAKTMI
ncbi:MAG TPA: hypothetical protein VMR62_13070 [Bryobacteraceae bacterium]|jgi:SepF-like predicted cell division protein (DUF552 family)|nr:hypothetical protein [Bryobacteraceae bacterium]